MIDPTPEHVAAARAWLAQDSGGEEADVASLARLLADTDEAAVSRCVEVCRNVYGTFMPPRHRCRMHADRAVAECIHRLLALIGQQVGSDSDEE